MEGEPKQSRAKIKTHYIISTVNVGLSSGIITQAYKKRCTCRI